MAEHRRWDTPPKFYKIQTRPLADFRYLWEAPHFQAQHNQITVDKVAKRKLWEIALPSMIPKGNNREILGVYHSVLKNGIINPLSCIEQDGLLYPVKGNQRLCVFRAIKMLVDHRHLSNMELTTAQKQWIEKKQIVITTGPEGAYDLDAIPCRIADYTEYPGDWTHDHPVARNHIGDDVKVRG